ncbi:hypothetical protein AAY473_022611 [Plecturocebus cupreus]
MDRAGSHHPQQLLQEQKTKYHMFSLISWSAVLQSWLTATSGLLGSSNSPASASQVARITSTHHHTQLIFVFLVEMGFYHVGQANLELLTSSDPLTSASQICKEGVQTWTWKIPATSKEKRESRRPSGKGGSGHLTFLLLPVCTLAPYLGKGTTCPASSSSRN